MSSDPRFPNPLGLISMGLFCAGVLFSGAIAANGQQRAMPMQPPVAMQPRQIVRPIAIPQGAHVVTSAPAVHAPTRPHLQPRLGDHTSAGHSGDHRVSGNRNIICGNPAELSLQQLISPFPTNGLNFEYLNAINSDLAIKAAIDPATELAVNHARQLNCGSIGSSGYVLFGGGYGVPEQVVQEPADDSNADSQPKPQVIVVQVPAATQSAAATKPTVVPEEEAPLPDQRPFVLVMRDGSQVQATAFTRSADQIVYIALDGLRHAIPLASIDADATVQLNSERGSQIQLSL